MKKLWALVAIGVIPVLMSGCTTVEKGGKNMRPAVKREGDQVTLDRFTHKGNWISYMGTLVSCARFLDPELSEAWLWGSTGYAFSLTIHEQLCPSGPYMPVGKFDGLLANTGLELERLSAESNSQDVAGSLDRMFDRTREAIDGGLPVMGWSLEHIDWYPISGYDQNGNYLFRSHNGIMKPYPHAELGKKAPGGLALLSIVRRGSATDDAVVVRDALRFALRMGRGDYSHELYTSGLGGYDVWLKALQQPQDPPADDTCFGHAFNAACWYECRRQALAFLEEAKKRLKDDAVAPLLEKAIGHYRTVSDQFKTLTELYPCQPGKNAPMRERFEDSALRGQAIAALTAARAAEDEGLKTLAEIEKLLTRSR